LKALKLAKLSPTGKINILQQEGQTNQTFENLPVRLLADRVSPKETGRPLFKNNFFPLPL
jgi:hypothetical protein